MVNAASASERLRGVVRPKLVSIVCLSCLSLCRAFVTVGKRKRRKVYRRSIFGRASTGGKSKGRWGK